MQVKAGSPPPTVFALVARCQVAPPSVETVTAPPSLPPKAANARLSSVLANARPFGEETGMADEGGRDDITLQVFLCGSLGSGTERASCASDPSVRRRPTR